MLKDVYPFNLHKSDLIQQLDLASFYDGGDDGRFNLQAKSNMLY